MSWFLKEDAPREKLLQSGAQSLSDSELLAIFLRTGLPGIHVLSLAQQILANFGSLYALISANYVDFCAQKGLGISKYTQLHAAVELSRRYLQHQITQESSLTSPDITRAFLHNLLARKEREIFLVMFLDNQNRMMHYEEMFTGTFNCVEVHPREIVRVALKYNAAALILAHNHPSGMPEPSQADRYITEKITQACQILDIKVLDHIVIGHGNSVSFAERGWL